ncbi:hypothetical protein [Aeromicrobium sp. UC242_57]|uniref:hypothetical protein n=1 Tax=Aeromicrobium sp. UC242_57 TaxID=3374624 RepID=UPI0037A119D2
MAVLDVDAPLRGPRSQSARAETPRWPLRRLPAALLRQGVLGYAGTLVVAWFLAGRHFVLPASWTYGVTVFVAGWLLYSFAALPAYERARSFKPSIRLVEAVGVISVGCLVAEIENTAQLRHVVVSIVAAAGFLAASALLHRQLLRRTPTVLVGHVDAVRRLESRWAEAIGRRRRRIVLVARPARIGTRWRDIRPGSARRRRRGARRGRPAPSHVGRHRYRAGVHEPGAAPPGLGVAAGRGRVPRDRRHERPRRVPAPAAGRRPDRTVVAGPPTTT